MTPIDAGKDCGCFSVLYEGFWLISEFFWLLSIWDSGCFPYNVFFRQIHLFKELFKANFKNTMKCLIWGYDRLLSQLETKKLLLTGKSISPSAFPWQQLQHGLHTWSQSRRCGGPNSSALPQYRLTTSLAPCCTAAPLEETQLGYGTHAVQTTTPGNVLSITVCLREEMGMNWLLQLAGWSMSLAFQKESLKTNAQSLKNFCWLQALTRPETLAEICEACVHTLWVRAASSYHGAQPPRHPHWCIRKYLCDKNNNLCLQGGFSSWSTKTEL